MTIHARLERFILGLHGLALLEGWPFADAAESDRRIALMRDLAERALSSELVHYDDLSTADAYVSWSQSYDESDNALLEAEEPVIRRLLADLDPGFAVDIACGTGRHSTLLLERGHRVLAVDMSVQMLRVAHAKNPSVLLARADLGSLPLPDACADLAICGLALTHVRDLAPAVAEFSRILRPGGRLILSDVHPIAVATGGQAFFAQPDGSRAVTRNEIHWPSAYASAFASSGLLIRGLYEPVFEAAFVTSPDPALREAAEAALPGLPFALVWDLERLGAR